ncbi:MAG TPA: phage antirepressor N-terminal domain-containing protein [Chryseolinea sp.]|nr:phage antirepressor N-terminal domain-containing protein [Chryseolinea sp.]
METSALEMFNATVKYTGEHIFIKPFCDFFQINMQNQYRSIDKDEILRSERIKKSSMLLFNDERARVALSKRGFTRWIQILNPQIVQVSLRQKLIQYQRLIFDFLFGKVERDEQIKVIAHRRDKLKRLKSKIAIEISLCEEQIYDHLLGKSPQGKLDFSSPKTIAS